MSSAVNLITNPSFETNLTGWTAAAGSAAQDTVVDHGVGNYSCKVTATGFGQASIAYSVTGLSIGKNYTVSFYVKIQSVGVDFSVVPSIAGVVSTQVALRSGDGFQRRYIGFTATATSHTLTIQSATNSYSGDVFWIDRVAANVGTLLPYFDGSYPFSAWTGTANASTSTNSAFDSSIVGNITTDEVVVVNGLCLNTLAWNVTSKTGRQTTAPFRGADIIAPGANGNQFVPNKPIDIGEYNLSMFILGAYPDGSVPSVQGQSTVFRINYERILRQCLNQSNPVTIYTWLPNGSVRTTQATLVGTTNPSDPTSFMGGRRSEVTLAFDVLPGVWHDYFAVTITGTPSSAWSNQSLALPGLADGTAAIDDSVVTVTGPIVNPVVSNAATGTSVTFTGTVPATQTWVIDSGAWTSKLNGTSVLSSTTHLGHPRFLLIDPGGLSGNPQITLQGTSTTSATNISITANRKHMIG